VKEGDVIRFGRIPFKIAKLVTDVTKKNLSSNSVADMSVDESAILSKKKIEATDADQSVDGLNAGARIVTNQVNQTTFYQEEPSNLF